MALVECSNHTGPTAGLVGAGTGRPGVRRRR